LDSRIFGRELQSTRLRHAQNEESVDVDFFDPAMDDLTDPNTLFGIFDLLVREVFQTDLSQQPVLKADLDTGGRTRT
jgi:hypothetical protein